MDFYFSLNKRQSLVSIFRISLKIIHFPVHFGGATGVKLICIACESIFAGILFIICCFKF